MTNTTISDPIGQAIAAARGQYVNDLCCSLDCVSLLLCAMARAGSILLEESYDGEPEAFFEAYLKHATAFERVTQHPDFAAFKAAVEEAWFGDRMPGPFLTSLTEEAVAVVIADLLHDWRRARNATYQQMVEQLAVQKVALIAAAADPGKEEHFIEDDYRSTEYRLKSDLEHQDEQRLERQYFLGDGVMFPASPG